MSFKSGFERIERESQFNTAGGSEFQVRGAAVPKYRLANDVRRNGSRSGGTDDDRVLRKVSKKYIYKNTSRPKRARQDRQIWSSVP